MTLSALPTLLPLVLGLAAGAADPVVDLLRAGAEDLARGGGDSGYEAGARRDPFVDPLAALPEGPHLPGLGGARIAGLTLEGISLAGCEPIAILRSSEPMALFAREGDRLADGIVQEVDFAHGRVLFQQTVEESDGGPRYRSVERRLAP